MSPRPQFSPRPRAQSHLLRSTALITLLPLLAAAQPVNAQEVYLDNALSAPNNYRAVDGNWSATDNIWYDPSANGGAGGYTSLGAAGGTGVLDEVAPGNQSATLTIIGTLRIDDLRVNDDGFILTGGALQGNGNGLQFSTANGNGVALDVASALNVWFRVGNGVTLNYRGQSSLLNNINVQQGGTLNLQTAGTTMGQMDVNGQADISGVHSGNVTVGAATGGLLKMTGGTITGTVNNGGTITLDGNQEGAIDGLTTNAGTININQNATLTGAVELTDAGTLNLSDGQLTGAVTNEGDIVISGNGATIQGNVVNLADTNQDGNSGLIYSNGGTDRTLRIVGRLTNSGRIISGYPSFDDELTIEADEILLQAGSYVESGDVILRGTEVNEGTLNITAYERLREGAINGGLRNLGTVNVYAGMGGWNGSFGSQRDYYAITNNGQFRIGTDSVQGTGPGFIEEISAFNNFGNGANLLIQANSYLITEVASGARGTLNNTGTITNNGTVSSTIYNLVGGTLTNGGTISGEVWNRTGALLTNNNTINGNVGNQIDATLVNAGTINGNVTNDSGGDLTSTGTIGGNLDNNGKARLSGTISGLFDNSGLDVVVTGDLSVNDLANSGTMTIASAADLTSSNLAENSGTLTVRGGLLSALANSGTVTNEGTISGTVTNQSNGNITNSGAMSGQVNNNLGGTLTSTNTLGALDNDGTASLQGAVTGLLDNSTNTLSLTGNLTVGRLNNSGTMTVRNGNSLSATVTPGVPNSGTMSNSGTLTNNGALSGAIGNSGTLNNNNTLTGSITSNSGTVNNSGSMTGSISGNSGTVVNTGTLTGGVTNQNGGSLTNSSTISGLVSNNSGGTLVSTGTIGSVDNDGAASLQGTVTGLLDNSTNSLVLTDSLNVGSLVNSGTINLNAPLSLTSTGTMTNTGTISVAGNLISGGLLTNSGNLNVSGTVDGTVQNNATLRLNSGDINGNVTNGSTGSSAGQMWVLGNSNVTGDLTNYGTITGTGGTVNLGVSGGTFLNYGALRADSGSTLTITADVMEFGLGSDHVSAGVTLIGSIANSGTMDYSTDSTLKGGGLINRADGEVTVSAALDAAGYNISNAGTFEVSADNNSTGNLFGVNQLTNSGGKFIIASTGAVTAQSAIVSGGAMTVAGTLKAPLTVTSGGTVLMAGGTVTGTVDNSGNLNGGGTIDGVLTNRGNVWIGGGRTLTSTQTVINEKTLSVGGTLDANLLNRTTGTTTLSDGRVDGNVTNNGTLNGRGGITGTLTNNNFAHMAGNVAGGITNNAGGRLRTSGNLTTASLTNTGQVIVDSGNRLTSTQDVTNQGSMILLGTLDTNLTNAAGKQVRFQGGTIDGTVTNNGDLRGTDGTITGKLTNTGLASIGGTLAAVENSGRLVTGGDRLTVGRLTSTGTVNVLEGRTLASGTQIENFGLVNVGGTLEAPLFNGASGTTFLTGGKITGAVTNNGSLSGSGEVSGLLVNNASMSVFKGSNLTTTLTVNRKDLLIGGTLSGTVQNQVGGTTTLQGGTMQGTLVNAGTVTGSGRVDGTLSNTGLVWVKHGSRIDATSLGNTGTLRVVGTLGGKITNWQKGTIALSGGTLDGVVSNEGTLTGWGLVSGKLTNTGTGTITIDAGKTLGATQFVDNRGKFTINGTLTGSVQNNGSLEMNNGQITGTVDNRSNASLSGSAGTVTNSGTLTTRGNLTVASLDNSGTTTVSTGTRLVSGSTVANTGTVNVVGTLAANLVNANRATTSMQGGTVEGNLDNRGILAGNGTIDGSLTTQNGSTTGMSGTITGNLYNAGGTIDFTRPLVIQGEIVNGTAKKAASAAPVLTQRSAAASRVISATPVSGAFNVSKGSTVTAVGGTTNNSDGVMNIFGTLVSDVTNYGTYNQSGTLDGSLTQLAGSAVLGVSSAGDIGKITGDLIYKGGTLSLGNGVSIGGTLDLQSNYTIYDATRNLRINAAMTNIASGATLTLGETLGGVMTNAGTLKVVGNSAAVTGNVANNGTIDMRGGGTSTVLTTGGISGDGTLIMDINTDNLAADRVVVSGGATTGNLYFDFANEVQAAASTIGKRITLLDVDESFGAANDYEYTFEDISEASERIVFSVDRVGANGDIQLVSQLNPAIGAMFANVTLVQSLIGSVVNRPTSPYVSGLVTDPGDKPCGIGGWGRVTGGHATVRGKTDNQVSELENEVTASYHGMQVGMDMACFDDRFGGWNMAFGVLGGVNIGDTRQPIYAINGSNSQATSSVLASVTSTDFQQRYAGVYATASKDRWVADLQLRYENTDFELRNKAVASTGTGLGISDPNFSSDGFTLSGSVSYSMPIAQTGWNFTPTAGFAWSKYSTDDIDFEDDFRMTFDDSERKVGFLGATVSRAYVDVARNSALQTFATATYYKDFADDAVSRLYNETLDGYETQVMTSENLKHFGEVSLGANYVKVLDPGRAGGGRQLSTSARIDGRFGDAIDSVGVTGQIRWQF